MVQEQKSQRKIAISELYKQQQNSQVEQVEDIFDESKYGAGIKTYRLFKGVLEEIYKDKFNEELESENDLYDEQGYLKQKLF